MINLATSRNKLRRIVFSRQAFVILFLVYVLLFLFLSSSSPISYKLPFHRPPPAKPPRRMVNSRPLPSLSKRIPCYGPRGLLLSQSPDDKVDEVKLDIPYPAPWTGSHEALGLDMTWTTVDGRYGPYGYGEQEESYNRTRVNWNDLDWQTLQKQCFERNARRFPSAARIDDAMFHNARFRLKNSSSSVAPQWHDFPTTRRTAVVVRTWIGYEYKDEDLQYLRSLVVETALKTGGEYQVILLVDMKDYKTDIWASEPNYLQGLRDAGVPREFESLTVLWDERLLDDWYPLVSEHRTMWQVFQPMQLFALHYPEFDHYWQLELDTRFTGDAGKFLDRMHDFSRNEPRKQAMERALFMHMQSKYGDYGNFSAAIDKANNRSATVWGPLRIPDIMPVGPEPPTRKAINDKFQWGVGEEADVVVTALCGNITKAHDWMFREWLGGFELGLDTPRIWCPPAIMRSSRSLLLIIHEAQIAKGMRIQSEATLPSFALWHGLKFSFPQHPEYYEKEQAEEFQNAWMMGGPAKSSSGAGPDELNLPSGMGQTFWWQSHWPRQVMNAWEGRKLNDDVPYPWILARKNGKVYVPNMMMHPVKHN